MTAGVAVLAHWLRAEFDWNCASWCTAERPVRVLPRLQAFFFDEATMSLLAPADWAVLEKTDTAVADFVSRVLELTQPPRRVSERRKDSRTPFPYLFELTPIEDHEIRVTDTSISVVGKQLASRGLDFFHTEVLPFKRAIVSFDSSLGINEHFILHLSWCRFLRPGWYDSGGRFTHIVTPAEFQL